MPLTAMSSLLSIFFLCLLKRFQDPLDLITNRSHCQLYHYATENSALRPYISLEESLVVPS